MSKKRGLGRGLDALLSNRVASVASTGDAGGALREISIERLRSGVHQPRQHFDEAALDALAESIKAQGIVEPLIVRVVEDGYEIVAGERRWRAARRAGLLTVPAVVRDFDDRTTMAVALVENIQRADLNPLEEARALARLIDECELTHEQVASAVGRSRAAVTNLLRLLDLPPEIQSMLRDGRLSLGHAKVLLGVARDRQVLLANRVVALGLSVRQTENLLRRANGSPVAPLSRPDAYADCVRDLRTALSTEVRVQAGKDGAGRIVIPFRDRAALENLVAQLSSGPG